MGEVITDMISGDGEPNITEIESLCVECEEQGMTRLLMTRIPYFREVIISSFVCEHCGNNNNELLPASQIQDTGEKYCVKITTSKDLSRQVVTTKTAIVSIAELEFEIPPRKGGLTTVEGILLKATEELLEGHEIRKVQDPELAEKISQFVEKLMKLKDGTTPFTLEIDDTSGNSFIENPVAPSKDPQMTIVRYNRTKEQDVQLGIFAPSDEEDEDEPTESLHNEVLHIDSHCQSCHAPCPVNMKLVNVPNFKEVVIMATNCDACGYRTNEVKGGAGVSELGRRITLIIENVEDLKRDLLKSETSSISIPELEFETDSGTLGGKFTTVEGILTDIRDSLAGLNPFGFGDSSDITQKGKLRDFCQRLNEIIVGTKVGVHIVLDDPAGNSYIQNLLSPEKDPQLVIIDYTRTFDQNEELGLNDMKTENYT